MSDRTYLPFVCDNILSTCYVTLCYSKRYHVVVVLFHLLALSVLCHAVDVFSHTYLPLVCDIMLLKCLVTLSQQRTLTPPDTWSCPIWAFVLMLRPFFPELAMSTDLLSFEHPSVHLFCLFALSVWNHAVGVWSHTYLPLVCKVMLLRCLVTLTCP